MNKKRIILLLLVTTLMMPIVAKSKKSNIELRLRWDIPTRSPMEIPFEIYLDDNQTLCIRSVITDIFTLAIKSLDGQMVYYTTTVNVVSGQDVFIDLKQLPSGTCLLSLENKSLEATGYLIL